MPVAGVGGCVRHHPLQAVAPANAHPVGLVALQGSYGGGPVVYIFAGLSMVLVPLLILFAFTQRTLTQSIAMTGLKG